MNDSKADQAAYLLKAIAHPMRLQILVTLSNHPSLNVSAFQQQFQIEQSLLSHNLIMMKDRGILDSKRQGKEIYYSIADPVITQLIRLLLADKVD